MEEEIRNLARNLRSQRYLLEYPSGDTNTINNCLSECEAQRTALGWRCKFKGHELMGGRDHQGSGHRWIREEVQCLRSGGQAQKYFKKGRIIKYVNAASRPSNAKLKRKKKKTIRVSTMQSLQP